MEAAADRLCDPNAEVSSHYLIGRNGHVACLVPEHLRAWHAGAGEWAGQDDVNSRSIGIELDNDGTAPFSEPLFAALETLLGEITARWDIRAEGVIGHSDMAPGRKVDPGPRFDWARLERLGLARRRNQAASSIRVSQAAFRDRARALGYTQCCDDAVLLDAVRLRYRPWGTGPLCSADIASVS